MARDGGGRTLFTVAGLPIRANASWLILVAVVVYLLYSQFFPQQLDAPQYVYLLLSLVGAAGLFGSLILHEMAHSLVARHFGMPVSDITLFVFGGVSKLEDEPPTAGSEFCMAIAGPLASVIIGGVLVAVWITCKSFGVHRAVMMLLFYVALINLVLAAFNLLPAFPLDGGRVLRSFIWTVTGDIAAATRAASRVGYSFGMLLIVLGAAALFSQAPIQGAWLILVGIFVQRAATGHRRMVEVEEVLRGVPVAHFLCGGAANVPRDLDVERFVAEFVVKHRLGYYPVVDEYGRLVGVVTPRDPQSTDRTYWPQTPVEAIMNPVTSEMLLRPDTDASAVLHSLRQGGERRLIVVRDGRPLGIVSVQSLIAYATK